MKSSKAHTGGLSALNDMLGLIEEKTKQQLFELNKLTKLMCSFDISRKARHKELANLIKNLSA